MVIDQQLRPFALDPDLYNSAIEGDFDDLARLHAHTLSAVWQVGNRR